MDAVVVPDLLEQPRQVSDRASMQLNIQYPLSGLNMVSLPANVGVEIRALVRAQAWLLLVKSRGYLRRGLPTHQYLTHLTFQSPKSGSVGARSW